MSLSEAERIQRKQLKTTFIAFLVVSLILIAVAVGLIVLSFFIPVSNWLFWVLLLLAVGIFVITLFTQRKSVSAKRELEALEGKHKKKR